MSGPVLWRSASVLVVAIGLLAACSGGGDAGPPSVSSFHYVEVTTGTLDGESLDSREEGYYRAPDSARVIGDASYSPLGLEEIVLGSQVWTRRASGWTASTTDIVCFTALDRINSILRIGGEHDDSGEIRDGPPTRGEPTLLYKWEYEDAGRLLISAVERSLGDSPSEMEALARTKEIFSDLSGTTELVVGKNTGRVYSLIQTSNGPKLSRRDEIVVDQYDQPVQIEPPPNVPAEETRGESRDCPDYDTEFPWIPAVAAAVFGPLLFLVGSAFLWPRRL
jgi:hypothetical protein